MSLKSLWQNLKVHTARPVPADVGHNVLVQKPLLNGIFVRFFMNYTSYVYAFCYYLLQCIYTCTYSVVKGSIYPVMQLNTMRHF